MNSKLANFEDLLAAYYLGTSAHEAAQALSVLIRERNNLALANLLRDYRERSVYSAREIEFRAATDRLMSCCSVMELASQARFVPDIQHAEFGQEMLCLLENKHLTRYYSKFYPTKLALLFRWRMAGLNHVEATEGEEVLSTWIISFLELDRRFSQNLDDGYLLRMLDSFIIDGCTFHDVVAVLRQPDLFIDHLMRVPKEQDVLSVTIQEFSLFMQFCFDLHKLLTAIKSQLLQSAIWHHYGYWFDIIGTELKQQLGNAVSTFLDWEPQTNDAEAVRTIQEYVERAREVLGILTSRKFTEPINTLAKKYTRL